VSFDVWMQVPGSKQGGWSKVASGVTEEQARVYQDTCHHKIHVEEASR
jgi:hypothetical protein